MPPSALPPARWVIPSLNMGVIAKWRKGKKERGDNSIYSLFVDQTLRAAEEERRGKEAEKATLFIFCTYLSLLPFLCCGEEQQRRKLRLKFD